MNILRSSKAKKILGDNPIELLKDYRFQSVLTTKLDKHNFKTLDRETFYEIVLWKLNRFPIVTEDLLRRLSALKKIKPGNHRKSETLLIELLNCEGIALPMASTILRFINPKAFQIIDDRVYRVIMNGGRKYPNKPAKRTGKGFELYLNQSVKTYFNYLDRLHEVCHEKLPFEKSDRILYLLDIELGNKIGSDSTRQIL